MIIAGVVVWVLFGIITMMAAEKKGRNGCGWFLLGVLLGPFGFIIALLLDPINESPSSQISHNDDASLTTPKPSEIRSAHGEEKISEEPTIQKHQILRAFCKMSGHCRSTCLV